MKPEDLRFAAAAMQELESLLLLQASLLELDTQKVNISVYGDDQVSVGELKTSPMAAVAMLQIRGQTLIDGLASFGVNAQPLALLYPQIQRRVGYTFPALS